MKGSTLNIVDKGSSNGTKLISVETGASSVGTILAPINKPSRYNVGGHGLLLVGTDRGVPKPGENEGANQDGVSILKDSKGDFSLFVVDGIGGRSGGNIAKDCSQEVFSDYILNSGSSIGAGGLNTQIAKRLGEVEGVGKSGIAHCAINLKDGKYVTGVQTGDVRAIVIKKDGSVEQLSKDEVNPKKKNMITNFILPNTPGQETPIKNYVMGKGDRLVISSDGLFDTYSNEEVADFLKKPKLLGDIDKQWGKLDKQWGNKMSNGEQKSCR